MILELLLTLQGVAVAQAGPNATGVVMTVRGPVDPASLGITLMHEHLASNLLLPNVPTGYRGTGALPAPFVRRFQETGRYFRVPRTAEQLAFWDRPTITADMHARLAQGWLTKSQFVLDDSAATREELEAFRGRGGTTLVDVTTVGIGRDPEALRRFAEQTGVHVVMGTGWYRWMFQPPDLRRRSIDDMASLMIRDITVGVGATGIRAGIIGEIPLDAAGLHLPGPMDRVYSDSAIGRLRQAKYTKLRSGRASLADIYDRAELAGLRAAARASRRTGVAITLHAPDPWIDYLDVIEQEGGQLDRVIIGHADMVLLDDTLARRALERGVTLQLDYQLQRYATGDVGPFDLLLDRVVWAVRAGFGAQILVSLDLCFRQGLAKYGGGGYLTLFDRIVPGLHARGLTDAEVNRILIDNPRRLLTIAAVAPTPR